MRCGAFHRVEGTLCLVRHGQAALSGSKTKAPGFAGGYLLRFRHVISGSLALASLNHTCRNLVPTFPQRSPPSLLTTAACGGLRSTPDCRPRRAFLHLSYSYAPPCGPALLVTQCHNQTHAVQQRACYSMTSSARRRNDSGILSPSALAVVRLRTKSNLVGCSTGISAGLAPRRILSTSSAARRYWAMGFGP